MTTQQAPKTRYIAAYGLLKSQKFVETLLGRSLKETETEMPLGGYQLRIVDREKLPLSVQAETPPGFRLYGLRRGTPDQKVSFRMLQLTDDEYELIRMTDFGDAIFRREGAELSIIDKNYYFAHFLKDPDLGEPAEVDEEGNYELYLNGTEEGAVVIAQDIRRAWLESHSPEGRPNGIERE